MDFVAQLWLPIVVSAVLVFVASSLVHMLIQYHKSDYRGFANEDAVRAAINAGAAAPGEYLIPWCSDMKDFAKPEMQQKFVEGPIGKIILRKPCLPQMGGALAQWFVLSLVVSVIAAYIAAKTLPGTATSGQVIRVVGTLTFLAYGFAYIQEAIWMGKPWSSVAKYLVDALIYAAVTAGTFAFFWK